MKMAKSTWLQSSAVYEVGEEFPRKSHLVVTGST